MLDHSATLAALPALIADDAALERTLAEAQCATYTVTRRQTGIDLPAWLTSGDDACERCWLHAQRLGVPLVRLPEVSADPAVAALLPPEQARRLRVVPLRAAHGLLAVAMEDPSNSEALAAVEFVSSDRVLPLMATARGIRDAIARSYDQVEDRETARQLGLDPSAAIDTSESEALRLSREQPVVRIVHGLIADAVARRASDITCAPASTAPTCCSGSTTNWSRCAACCMPCMRRW